MSPGWGHGLDGWTATLALALGFLGLLYWYSVSAFSKLEEMGIAHPRPTPFIGNLLLFKKGFWEGAADIIKQYGPIAGYYLGRQPIVLISDPEAIKQVLQKDFANFPNRMKLRSVTKPLSDSLLCLRDERWRRVRSILTPTFSAARMKEMCPLIHQACDALLANLLSHAHSEEPCDVQRLYAGHMMDLVTSVAFGTKVDSQNDPDHPLLRNSRKFLELFKPFKPLLLLTLAFPSIMFPVLRLLPNKNRDRINGFFRQTVRDMIALRDQKPANERRRDFLQLMLDARGSAGDLPLEHFDVVNQADLKPPPSRDAPGRLDEDEILGQACLFLIAGYENSCSLLSFTTYLLATHPQCQEKLLAEVDQFAETHTSGGIPALYTYHSLSDRGERRCFSHGIQDGADYSTVHDLPYLDMVICESLRMYPPAFRFAREAARDCIVMGHKIQAGTVLEVPVSCVQNDPRYWPEPERFRPERFTAEEKQKRHPFTFLPFGAGPRSCIGMRMAVLKVKITLFRILQRVRFQTCPQTQVPLQFTTVSTLRPKNGVYVKVVAR